jgi:hypothetical protein
MRCHGHVWFYWSVAFLIPWLGLFVIFPGHRRAMWWASAFTMPFGLTEPLFVPVYWNPPSLFGLAQKTGFDIESLIFCFGMGGVCAVLYNMLTRTKLLPMSAAERALPLHRHHLLVLATPFVVFAALFFIPWNPIYPGITAMFAGTAATFYCRPDLKTKTWVGGGLFLVYYVVFLQGLRLAAPGYIEHVWNFKALLGVEILGLPVEELLFAAGFGLYWSGVYEHFAWRRSAFDARAADRT